MPQDSEIIDVFSMITDPSMMEQFFAEILTPKEIKDIKLRWELIKMVDQGVPQREIASKLRISLCKITRGAKLLKDKKSVTNKILKG